MGRPPRISRTQILDAARVVFVQKGFEAATLSEIAGRLEVTPAAVLRHCGSKQKLFTMAMQGSRVELPEFIAKLRSVDPEPTPRMVLRNLAERFVPFVQATLGANLAVYMHGRSQTSFFVPFDTTSNDTPPRRGLRIVSEYFRRASDAGVMRVRDPRAAALLFMGSLQSYVFLHQVLNVSAKPFPLPVWIDQLIDVWTSGAIVSGGHRARSPVSADQTNPAPLPPRRPGRSRISVGEGEPASAGDDRVRNARSADGQRGLAVRRPRGRSPRG